MIAFLIGVLITVLVLMIVAVVVPGFAVGSAGDALVAAIIVCAAGWAASHAFGAISIPVPAAQLFWIGMVWTFVVNTISLALAAAFVSGLQIRSFGALIAAAVLLTALDAAAQYAVSSALLNLG